jgi:hypothetical protein
MPYRPILEAAGLALVCVADNCLRRPGRIPHGLPLASRREASASTSCESALADQVDHSLRCQLSHRALDTLVSSCAPVALERGALRNADLGEDALFYSAGILARQRGPSALEPAVCTSHEHRVASQDRDRIITPAGARHGNGTFGLERPQQLRASLPAAHGTGAYPRGGLTPDLPGKVMIERHVPEQLGDRNSQARRHLAECLLVQVTVALMDRVEDR